MKTTNLRLQGLIAVLAIFLSTSFTSCDKWLDRNPLDKLTQEDVYSSVGTVSSVIAGLYNQLPDWGAIYQDPGYYTHFDEGMLGQNVNNIINYDYSYARYYDYNIIRDINYHLKALKTATFLSDEEMRYYVAEARFLRAYVYFEMVKRMGGVPLITEIMEYDSDKPVESYQVARSTEAEIYDFIRTELDEIKNDLDLPAEKQYNRASKGAALAMKCRAMLYAGTLAKYNSAMPVPVSLEGGEVGIPASRAEGYFRSCVEAAEELLAMKYYALYDVNTNKSANFYEALTVNGTINRELIFVKEYSVPTVTHNWTYNNLSRTMREGGFGGTGGTYINPSLNLVDAFDNLDGTHGKLMPYTDPTHEDVVGDDSHIDTNPDAYIHYKNIGDIFANKDPRLAGTIILPGSKLGANAIDLQAGWAVYNESTGKYAFKSGSLTNLNKNVAVIGGVERQLTGLDGPTNDVYATRTGFYVRKSMDESPSDDAKKSGIQWVRYRLSEVYLNAAEAAFELGDVEKAKGYLKTVRDRAGVETLSQLTLNDIRNERRVELAFEGHRLFDVKRWRIADELFDGSTNTSTAMISGLWPYKVYRPGHETDGTWIYVRRIPTEFKYPRKFVLANYYSSFSTDALTANPKLVKNPGQ